MTAKLALDHPADGVARLTISNPERRGALDHEILDALAGHARTLDARCLVIRGSGEVFSAGYDIGNLEDQGFEENAERLVAHPFQDAIEALDAYPYPVLAALNGHAIGGGLELALTCDIRVAARGIRVGMPPAKLGLIYSHTGLARFIDVCGVANTAQLFYVGATVDAERARAMGLVNELVDPAELDTRALELAAEIAGQLRRCRSPATSASSARCATGACPRTSSASSSSCASPASARRTSARECAPSPRSARRSGRGASRRAGGTRPD